MRRIFPFIFALFALGPAFGGNPDTETLARVKERIQPYVAANAGGRKFPDWATYTFQYQGREESGRQFVFMNAFCISGGDWPLTKRMMTVTDGGTCFFNVKYDPETNMFFELRVHGDA